MLSSVFEFEAATLWQAGIVMRDAGSFLNNVAVYQDRVVVLDFSSFSNEELALEALIKRNHAERRIHLFRLLVL